MTNGQQPPPQEPPHDDPPPGRWNSLYTLIISGIVAVAYAWLVGVYFKSLEGDYSIESTRLLIVLTLIIAMLGFGGLLICCALFSRRTGLQDRFRPAREIFLIFSGIFGTIIGFYFGATDTDALADQPKVELNWASNQLIATVTGGTGPFVGIFTPKDSSASQVQRTDKRSLTFPNLAQCPEDASVLVFDGRGHRAEATEKCETASQAGGSEQGDQATENIANTTDTNTTDSVRNTH
jgi:hypothetical protein